MEAPRSRASPVPIADLPRPRSAWRAFAGSFRFAWYGVVETALHQRNMRIHLVAALWVGLLGATVPLTIGERLALLLCVFLVLSAEVANSALEALVDLVTRERDDRARAAKDAGAGAVLVLAACAVAVLALVLVRATPALAESRGALVRQGSVGLGISVAMAGLLTDWPRPRAVDLLLAAAGVVLLVPAAVHTLSPVFTAVDVVVFLVAVGVAIERRRAAAPRVP